MKKLRLLCIPPYEGMYTLLMNLAAQRSDVELLIHMGNLDEGLNAAINNREKHIDAIISRGGTADTIRQYFDIPVYDIAPSVYDVLRTIRLAQGISEKFTIVGFPSITKTAEMLRDIMQFNFEIHTINSVEDCESCLCQLREEGTQIIVGDTISVTYAKKLGAYGLLIVSGIESVESAIDNIKQMYQHYSSILKNEHLLSDLLKSNTVATVVYTPTGEEVFSSLEQVSDEFLKLLRQKVTNVITSGNIKIIRHIDDITYSIRGRLLQSEEEEYCVYQISQFSTANMFDRHMIRYMSSESDFLDCNPIEYYLGNSETISTLHRDCKRFAALNCPVILVGEQGTGKDRFAHYIYSNSKLKHSTFLIIDVGILDEKGWEFLLASDNSPLTDTGLTIYFKQMNRMPAEQKQPFLVYLKNSRTTSANRLFFSYSISQESPFQNDELFLYLTDAMHCLQFHIPSLSQRREDIPALVGLYINSTNIQYGTRVIGLDKAALLTLQNYVWERNVDQLVQTVQELVLHAKASYISNDDVQALLACRPVTLSNSADYQIDLNRSLDDIIQDVVQRVYKMEDMNQTRTAEHLGISRSTVWRILKN